MRVIIHFAILSLVDHLISIASFPFLHYTSVRAHHSTALLVLQRLLFGLLRTSLSLYSFLSLVSVSRLLLTAQYLLITIAGIRFKQHVCVSYLGKSVKSVRPLLVPVVYTYDSIPYTTSIILSSYVLLFILMYDSCAYVARQPCRLFPYTYPGSVLLLWPIVVFHSFRFLMSLFFLSCLSYGKDIAIHFILIYIRSSLANDI